MHLQITAQAGDLAAQLGWVARTLPARPSMPVLAGVHLQVGDGSLRLTATDCDTWAHAQVEARTSGPGTLVLPGRLLADLLARVPATAQVHLEADEARVRIEAGPTRATVMTLPADEYPAAPSRTEPVEQGRAEAADLAAAVSQVAGAASTDESLPVLTCVRARMGPDQIVLTATDRYRLSQQCLEWEPACSDDGSDPQEDVLVPARTLTQAAKALQGTVVLSTVSDEVGPRMLALADQTRTVVTRLDDAQPLATDVFFANAAEDAQLRVDVEARELHRALDRVGLFTDSAVSPVCVEVGPGGLLVRASQGEGADGSEEVAAQVTGAAPVQLHFNPRLLSGAVSSARAEHVLLQISDPRKAVLLTPADDEQGAEGAWQIVMPIRTSS